MELETLIPVLPAGIALLLAFFAPYAVAIVEHPRWAPNQKKLVAIVVSLLLSAIAMAAYYLLSGELPLPWPAFSMLFIVISQAAYALVLKPSVKRVEARVGVKDTTLVIDPIEAQAISDLSPERGQNE